LTNASGSERSFEGLSTQFLVHLSVTSKLSYLKALQKRYFKLIRNKCLLKNIIFSLSWLSKPIIAFESPSKKFSKALPILTIVYKIIYIFEGVLTVYSHEKNT
jgi:hypothetical protein